jgi:hypothetical protein
MAMTLVGSTTLSVAAATISITGIPQTGKDLLVTLSARSNDASVYFALLYPNGATTNASRRTLEGGSGSVSASSGSNFLGLSQDTGATANVFASTNYYIANYANSSVGKILSIEAASETNVASSVSAYIRVSAGFWSTTSAISSIEIKTSNGSNFVANTYASVYVIS